MQTLVVGHGYLGSRLAKAIHEAGKPVQVVKKNPIDVAVPYPVLLRDMSLPLTDMLPAHDAVIIALAPYARNESAYHATYVTPLKQLQRYYEANGFPKQAIFVSSTAVYGNEDGKAVTESTHEAPKAFNGRIMLEAENIISSWPCQVNVVRLSGIYGPGRLRLLDNKQPTIVSKEPNRWSNRIHVADAVNLIRFVQANTLPTVVIGSDTTPLTQADYLSYCAALLGKAFAIEPHERYGLNKQIMPGVLKAAGYQWLYPDARMGVKAILT